MITWKKWPGSKPDGEYEDYFIVDDAGFLLQAEYINGKWIDEIGMDCTETTEWWTELNMPRCRS